MILRISLASVSCIIHKYQLLSVFFKMWNSFSGGFLLTIWIYSCWKKYFSILCKPSFASKHLVLSWFNITLFLLFLTSIWMKTKNGDIHKSHVMFISLLNKIRFSENIYHNISQILLTHGNYLCNLFNKCCEKPETWEVKYLLRGIWRTLFKS